MAEQHECSRIGCTRLTSEQECDLHAAEPAGVIHEPKEPRREEFAFVRMVLKRLALPSVVFFRPKTDSLHLPPQTNDGTSYGPAIASLVDENGLTYTGTELVDLGLQAPALLAAFDSLAAERDAALKRCDKLEAFISYIESPALKAWRALPLEGHIGRAYTVRLMRATADCMLRAEKAAAHLRAAAAALEALGGDK